MHEINNINKRLRTIKHFSNYFFIALVIMVLTGVIVLAASGYDIDRKTGQVIQNGILLIETDPAEATVSINGQAEVATTPAKYPIPQGAYSVMIEKDGYRPWESQVEVYGTRVNWLYYPVLIPETISTTTVNQVNNLNFMAYNNTRNAIITGSTSNIRSLSLYDLGASSVIASPLVLPEALFTETGDSIGGGIEFLKWSESGRFILLRYTVNNQDDLVVVDLNSTNDSFNIDKLFNRDFDNVEFNSEDGVIAVDNGLLFELTNPFEDLGVPIETQVADVVVSESRVWIVKSGTSGSELSLLSDPTQVQITSSAPKVTISTSNWENVENVVVDTGSQILIYKDPNINQPDENVAGKVLQLEDYKSTTVSPNGRFIALHNNSQSIVYDLDNLNTYELEIGLNDSLNWLDGHRLYYDVGGQLYIQDFDGNNNYQIASYNKSYPVFTDQQFDAIYTISERTVDKQLLLRRSSLEAN